MSTQTEKTEIPIISDMIVIGRTSIHNIQLISKKLLNIIGYIVTQLEPDNGVFSIVLNSKNRPVDKGEPIFARLYTDSRSIVINLLHHFNSGYDNVSTNKDQPLSLKAIIWQNLIISVLHEIHHSKKLMEAKKPEDIVWDEAEEKLANEWAMKKLEEMAKKVNLEIPPIDEEPILGPMLKDVRELLEGEEEEEWAVHQRYMYDNNLVYSDKGMAKNPVDITTFKEYLRLTSDDKDNASWGEDHKTTFVYEPMGAPTKTEISAAETSIFGMAPLPSQATIPGIPTLPPVMAPNYDMSYDVDYDIVDDTYVDDLYSDSGYDANYDIDMPDMVAMMPQIMGMPSINPIMSQPSQPDAPFVNPVMMAMGMNNADTNNNTPTYNYAGNNTPQTFTTVPKCELSIEEQKQIVKIVLMRLYTHIFTKCGFDPKAPTSFTNAGAILESVYIGDIPNANKIFLSMDIVDGQGTTKNDVQIIDNIKGRIFNKSGLPGYWLWLNINGFKMKRTFVPQNPNKMKGEYPAPYAQNVRKGYCVCWFIANNLTTGGTEMKAKIETMPGMATVYTENPFNR